MFSSARKHLSYANVVATMALVFAMGGTAIAAKHYLITSTSQISPTVLKAIEVKIASRVPAGKEGKAGKEGLPGKEGPEGKVVLANNASVSKLSSEEQERLQTLLAHMQFEPEGIDKKPTIQFTGVNVQILSGAGSESAGPNGEGNLVVGYDASLREQTGSNNIVIGSSEQKYTSYGALVAGSENEAIDPYTDVFGLSNHAEGEGASVSGGRDNLATDEWSSVSGGYENTANALAASVSGGDRNQAQGTQASVSGGHENEAKGEYSSVGGGALNVAGTLTGEGEGATIGGGYGNKAKGNYSSIFGGKDETATGLYEAMP